MVRVAWATDIHLNFVAVERRQKFYESIAAREPDAVFLTGDIAESDTVGTTLMVMEALVCKPVYFVLGSLARSGGRQSFCRPGSAEL